MACSSAAISVKNPAVISRTPTPQLTRRQVAKGRTLGDEGGGGSRVTLVVARALKLVFAMVTLAGQLVT